MILNIKQIAAFSVGLSISIILFMPSETAYIKQPDTPQVDEDPALLTAPEPQILATSTSITEPEPLPDGVICLDDCPLFLDPNDGVEAEIKEFFKDTPVMIAVAKCESTFRQWDTVTGEPLKNPGSSATGAMQLMASYHREPASYLGWDINTLEGNLAYAWEMFQTSGLVPWEASRYCWGSAEVAINKGISADERVSPPLLAVH